MRGSNPRPRNFFLYIWFPGRRPEHRDGILTDGLVLSINKAHARRIRREIQEDDRNRIRKSERNPPPSS